MKPKTWSLPKFRALAERLDIGEPFAAGILEAMWHLAATFDEERGQLPTSDPAELTAGWRLAKMGLQAADVVAALIAGRWIDDRDGRLFVHDWEEHRPGWINERIRKREYKRQHSTAAQKPKNEQSGERPVARSSARTRGVARDSAPSDSDSVSDPCIHGSMENMGKDPMGHGPDVFSVEEIAGTAEGIFKACGYSGNSGGNLWKAAALLHADQLSASEVFSAAQGAKMNGKNKPAHFYATLRNAIKKRGENLDELCKTVRIEPHWPEACPQFESQPP